MSKHPRSRTRPSQIGPRGSTTGRGSFSELLVYHDDEALYIECKGKDSGVVRFSFEMLETLTEVIQEEQQEQADPSPKK